MWSILLEKIKPGGKRFWKLSRSLRGKRKNQILNLEIGTDKLVSDCLADAFSQSHYLTMNYTHPSEININRRIEKFKTEAPFLENIEYINESEMTNILSTLKCSKSPGFDEIPNILLKNLPEIRKKLLVSILNSCIRLNYFPSEFKKAKVVAF